MKPYKHVSIGNILGRYLRGMLGRFWEGIWKCCQYSFMDNNTYDVLVFSFINSYVHIELVVAFLVVNFFGFSVITRNPTMHFGPKLEEIFLSVSRSFLYLSGTCLRAINPSFLTPKFSRKKKPKKLTTIYILA